MSELERLARAVARGLGYDYDDLYASKREYYDDRGARHDVNTPRKPDMIEAARAILRELREPTEETAAAGLAAYHDLEGPSIILGVNEIHAIQQAMLDHILSEGNT